MKEKILAANDGSLSKNNSNLPFDLLDADAIISGLSRAQEKVASFSGRQPHHDLKHFAALYWRQAA